MGTLKFGSTSATAATTFQNSIDLGSVDRTIQVDDNPNTDSDYAEITGSISGSGGIVKNGAGVLKLSGANSYTRHATINGGVLQAGINGGAGIPVEQLPHHQRRRAASPRRRQLHPQPRQQRRDVPVGARRRRFLGRTPIR